MADSPSKLVFKCAACTVSSVSQIDILTHLKKSHTCLAICEICRKYCKNKLGLHRHLASHIVEKDVQVADQVSIDAELSKMKKLKIVSGLCLKLTNSKICKTIAAANGMIAKEVPGDGSCQYHSLVIGLQSCGYPRKMTVNDLRIIAYNEILRDVSLYANYTDRDILDFADGVKNKAWGDEITLMAICSALNICIQVYSVTMLSHQVTSIGNVNSEYHVYLTLDNRISPIAHYGALVLVSSEQGGIIVPRELTLMPAVSCEEVCETNTVHADTGSAITSSTVLPESLYCRSSRINRTYADVVRSEVKSQQCPYCKKYFSNLLNHKKCINKKTERDSDVESVTSFSSVASTDSTSRRSHRIAERICRLPADPIPSNTNSPDKEQCKWCKRFFVDITKHKQCHKQPIQDSPVKNNIKLTSSTTNSTSNEALKHSPSTPIVGNIPRTVNTSPSKHGRYRKQCVAINEKDELNRLAKENPKYDSIDSNDPNYRELKKYHDYLSSTIENITTLKLSLEVSEVIDVDEMKERLASSEKKPFSWSKSDEHKLTRLTEMATTLKCPNWPWSADNNSSQGKYNESRFHFLIEKQLQYKILKCPQCSVTTLLVGLDEIYSDKCMQCLELNRKSEATRNKYEAAWAKVKPSDDVPDLPVLNPAEQAVISLIQPIVTIKRNFIFNKKYRQESINLLHNAQNTWCKILPRADLKDRFIVIERRFKSTVQSKYMLADVDKVRTWLKYLLKNHSVYSRKLANGEIELSDDALQVIESQSELASVDIEDEIDGNDKIDNNEQVLSAELDSGLSTLESFSFDNHDYLYLKKQHALKVTQSGTIKVIPDENPVRHPVYDPQMPVSVIFPALFPHGEEGPTDCHEHVLSRFLLKKQCQFAQNTPDGRQQYTYTDGVYLMHQYARIVEMDVRGTVGWYLSLHPENSHIPVQSLIDAFKEGMNHDEGAVDRNLPDLQGIMTKMRNSRERWFSERLGIETISRDKGDGNLFFTINTDCRSWADTRRLLFELNEGPGKEMPPDYFETDTDKFTKLLDKFAVQLTVYLCKKAKLFMKAFFDICGIPELETDTDCTSPEDRTTTGWYWSRVEFTQTRGVPHWHCIAKLPNVLDTAILSRMVQNMRVVRNELKYGNIKDVDKAWHIIKMGLLASRYLVVFADSVSTSAFFTDEMSTDQFDESKVIDLNAIRSQFVADYASKNINKTTHPIMRQFNDTECDPNTNKEIASVAAVSCMHHCIESICGGNKFGKNCRFSFPLKLLKYTVIALLEVTDNQMEAQILHRRTNDRIPNLQKYFLKYWRANHDFTVLADAAHKMRYAAKYVSKSHQIETLLNDVIENLERRQSSVVPPNIKQVLSHLLLADCSHRAYLTKPQLAYYVMDLPQITRSYTDVKVVGHYPRATIIEPKDDSGTYEFSDRTDYSAYSERCQDKTRVAANLTRAELANMSLREFSETVNFRWIDGNQCKSDKDNKKKTDKHEHEEDEKKPRKLKCRDKNSGHWLMSKKRKSIHVRSSTLLYADNASNYIPDDDVERFFDLSREHQLQLKRIYQELIMYVPWKDDPDTHFLPPDIVASLNDDNDPDKGSRYSLRRLNEYWKVYMRMSQEGTVAPVGSQWRRDNQYSNTMFLANHHNRSVHQDRVANDGVFVAKYETAEELEGTDIDIRLRLSAETDDDVYPSVTSFVPSDVLEQVHHQNPPTADEVHVAFPEHRLWKEIKTTVTRKSSSLFMANPPKPEASFSQLTPMQQHVVELIVSGQQKIVYVYGKAGTGKTLIAQTICFSDRFAGKVQAAAGTGKAASNFHGPTIHGAFQWSVRDKYGLMTPAKKQKLENFYETTELFIFDEINACGADILCMIDETMKELFNPVDKNGKRVDKGRPFGGKSVLFLGDSAQLRPVGSAAIYDKSVKDNEKSYKSKSACQYFILAQKGQKLYQKYLVPNCVYLQQGKRNSGLLQKIMDNLRQGKQTDDDLDKLTLRRQKYPFYIARRGIHYSNESASLFNIRQLWDDCQMLGRRFYICRAIYYTTSRNDNIVQILSSVPACEFGYAPDVLCLSEGCEVRLIRNLDTSAGLVTNSTGRVVRIVYNNQDVPALISGEHPPPYCIVVSFSAFVGFRSKLNDVQRSFPFTDHTLVPIYHERFTLDKLPPKVSKLQDRSLCFREQFPIDLSTNLTAHRGQGQNWKECSLSVNLGFESPQNKIPADASSITYVACTRITRLKDLFLSPIFPGVWRDMGKSKRDTDRREHEEDLKSKAKEFASKTGKYQECLDEINFTESEIDVENEWQDIVSDSMSSDLQSSTMLLSDAELQLLNDGLHPDGNHCIDFTVKPVDHERFIGIDQGLKTFSMVAVDRKRNCLPRVVDAFQLNLLNLGILDHGSNFKSTDVLMLLEYNSPLFEWMQTSNGDGSHKPNRVIVVLEQMSPENSHYKQLGKDLGIAIQGNVDVNKCVVKLSQPHIHRRNGPMFKLGTEIITACLLKPASYDDVKKTVVRKRDASFSKPVHHPPKRCHTSVEYSDVEPSDSENDDVTSLEMRRERNTEYRNKKRMSSEIFKFFIHATSVQQAAMQVEIDSAVQQFWINCESDQKLDDLGDALLHALDQVLCNTSNYRQLLPPPSLLEKNRTVVVVVLPDKICWVTTECLYNQIVIEDFGIHDISLQNLNYTHDSTVDLIRGYLPCRLAHALNDFGHWFNIINPTSFIKVIVKQIKQNTNMKRPAKAAGALTNATVKAMTTICDILLPSATLRVDNNRKTGWLYSRKCESTGRQFVVIRSSGKHLNAVLSCLQWMKSNLPDFVRDRPLRISKQGMLAFFEALRNVAVTSTDTNSTTLESIQLNHAVIHSLKFFDNASTFVKTILADLILIALNNNQQYIRAVSDNFRKHIDQ